jgi:virulence-associated protein VapD
MIKMQIVMDDDKITNENRCSVDKIYAALDNYLVDRLQMKKAEGGFYLGADQHRDFSRFGRAFSMLSDQDWFLDNVKTWLYFNSDSSDDFIIEDFRDFCLRQKATA